MNAISTSGTIRWSVTSTLLGGLLWLLLFGTSLSGGIVEVVERLVLLAVLLISPLVLGLTATPEQDGHHPLPYRVARWVQPVAALLVILSFLLPAGFGAAALTLGWLFFTGLVGLFGLVRLLSHYIFRADELCIDVGLVYVIVGGIWLLLSRLGANPLSFNDMTVLLTAAHFHYAGFALPVLAGMTGRQLAKSEVNPGIEATYRLVAAGIIGGPPLVALGITFSELLEMIAVTILAGSVLMLSALLLFIIIPRLVDRSGKVLLTLSAIAMVAPMFLAATNTIGTLPVALPQMVAIHGWGNALGVLAGLIAWSILRPASELPPITYRK